MGTTTANTSETEGGGTTGGGSVVGCPDPLPDGWIYCQDFENLGDPFEHFEPYFPDATNFEVGATAAFSGERSLRIRYTEAGDDWSGEAWVRFGDAGNAGPVFASGEVFEEIWARVYVRTQDDWAGGGFGEVFGLDALEGAANARVAVVNVASVPANEFLTMQTRSCVVDGALPCDGNQDWNTDRVLQNLGGSTVVADVEQGPMWHCLVLHVALNEVGMTDGFAELIVDGVEDIVFYDLDLRGTWDQTGLNTLRLESSWPGGPAAPVERYVDDLVIAAAPLDCG